MNVATRLETNVTSLSLARPWAGLSKPLDPVDRVVSALASGDLEDALRPLDDLAERIVRDGTDFIDATRGPGIMTAEGHFRRELRKAIDVLLPDLELCHDPLSSWRSVVRIAAGSALSELGRHDEGQASLREARDLASVARTRLLERAAALLEADIADRTNDGDALEILATALRLCREAGVRELVLVSDERVAALCGRALEHRIETDYVRDIIRLWKLAPPTAVGERWPYSIHVRTLGGFELRVDGQHVVPARKAQVVPQRMLETLVALGGRNIEKSHLTDLLWPDSHGDAGAQAFDTTLYRLRKMLNNPAALVLIDGKLSLSTEHVWTDVWEVERILATHGPNSIVGVAEHFRAARRLFELYRGPLHAGSEQRAWVVPRARLHERVIQTIARAAEAIADSGDVGRARILFSEAINVDPTVEGFYQGLMRCAIQLGARAEVARTFERCRRVLKAAFGVEPSEATRELWQRGAKSA